MITDPVNQIILEGAIPTEWELSTIVNRCKEKGSSLDKRNYRGLKITNQILKIARRIIENLIREQVDMDKMQFGFMPGRGIKTKPFTPCLS